jgi:molybdopterin-containing oxidoreductase family iron-sulfur binding subunit
LAQAIDQDQVELLIILGGNPVFTAPVDFGLAELLLRKEKLLRFHLTLYQDETSRLCQWHLPEAHYLEAWSDTRAFDGTVTIVQPLIQPLYEGRSAHELLSILSDQQTIPGFEIVRGYWRKHYAGQKQSGDFEDFWQTSVHDGIVAGTRFKSESVSLQKGWEKHLQTGGGQAALADAAADEQKLELVFQPDPTIYDGRFANNGWLQELPKPLTKLTWDNAAIMSPATARRLGVGLKGYQHGGEHGGYQVDVVELQQDGRKVSAPVWIMPGHADGSITISLGYGRAHAGKVGGSDENAVGFDAYRLRTSERSWFAPDLRVHKTGAVYPLACTQQHHLMENRDVVRAGTLEEYRENPRFAAQEDGNTKRQ